MKVLLLAVCVLCAAAADIETRGAATWPTVNHYRVRVQRSDAAPLPIAVDLTLPPGFNPDSVRVYAGNTLLPSKTEWRTPNARVSFRSTGAREYHVYFDEGRKGETVRLVAPAMVGTGDRITYGRAGVRGRLAVGLWPHPAPLDLDDDGDIDLIVGCGDRPYNGTYLFRNIGSNDKPLYDRAEWLGPGPKELVAADFNGDGSIDLVTTGGYFSDVKRNRMSRFVKVTLPRDYWVGRDDMWYPFDWDGDGRIDVLAGVSDWREYGWDDAFNEKGEWTRGPLHGYVWFHRNTGTNEQPQYAEPVRLPVDLYGSPSPTPVDWLGRGVHDLITGSFVDTVTLFRNTGTRTAPKLNAGELIRRSV